MFCELHLHACCLPSIHSRPFDLYIYSDVGRASSSWAHTQAVVCTTKNVGRFIKSDSWGLCAILKFYCLHKISFTKCFLGCSLFFHPPRSCFLGSNPLSIPNIKIFEVILCETATLFGNRRGQFTLVRFNCVTHASQVTSTFMGFWRGELVPGH